MDVRIAEMFRHEDLGNDLIQKDVLQDQQFQCLGLEDEMADQTTIQELEHLVDDAHLQADSNDISKIIQYHDYDVRKRHNLLLFIPVG